VDASGTPRRVNEKGGIHRAALVATLSCRLTLEAPSAPCCAADTRSAGSGDQPSTVGMPARLAWRASEPPIARRPMMPSLEGRTEEKVAGFGDHGNRSFGWS